jgi:hypothetical protein
MVKMRNLSIILILFFCSLLILIYFQPVNNNSNQNHTPKVLLSADSVISNNTKIIITANISDKDTLLDLNSLDWNIGETHLTWNHSDLIHLFNIELENLSNRFHVFEQLFFIPSNISELQIWINISDRAGSSSSDSLIVYIHPVKIDFKVSMNRTEYDIGEAIDLICEVSNIGQYTTNLSAMDYKIPNPKIKIYSPEGYVLYPRLVASGYPKPIMLNPNDKIQYEIRVNGPNMGNLCLNITNYNFTEPGTYYMDVTYFSDYFQNVWQGEITIYRISFSIK